MDGHVKVGGVWKKLEGLHVKVSGTWKEVKAGYIRVSGAWKQFYANATVILTGTSLSPNSDIDTSIGGVALAGWSFESGGDLTKESGSAWAQPEWYGSPSETTHQAPDQTYYIRATLDAGSAPDSGPALSTWHSLATTRTWSWTTGPSPDTSEGTLQIEIARDSGGTDIVDTGYYQGSAETTP